MNPKICPLQWIEINKKMVGLRLSSQCIGEVSLHPTRFSLIFICIVPGRRMEGIRGQNLLLGFGALSQVPRRTIHRKGCIIRPRAVTHGKRLAGLGEGQLGGGSRREPEGWHRPVSRDIVPWHACTTGGVQWIKNNPERNQCSGEKYSGQRWSSWDYGENVNVDTKETAKYLACVLILMHAGVFKSWNTF